MWGVVAERSAQHMGAEWPPRVVSVVNRPFQLDSDVSGRAGREADCLDVLERLLH